MRKFGKRHFMRKFSLCIIVVILSAINIQAQTLNDQSQVLQICIDLPGLKEFYHGNEIYVMQHEVSFNNDLNVVIDGYSVVLLEKDEVNNRGVKDFFVFRKFEVINSVALLEGQYVLNYKGAEQYISVDLELIKAEGSWTIKNSKIERK